MNQIKSRTKRIYFSKSIFQDLSKNRNKTVCFFKICFYMTDTLPKYKYLVFRPNNGSLIKRALDKRPWWEVYIYCFYINRVCVKEKSRY